LERHARVTLRSVPPQCPVRPSKIALHVDPYPLRERAGLAPGRNPSDSVPDGRSGHQSSDANSKRLGFARRRHRVGRRNRPVVRRHACRPGFGPRQNLIVDRELSVVQAVHRLHTASMTEIRLTWNRSVRHPLDALRFSKEWTPKVTLPFGKGVDIGVSSYIAAMPCMGSRFVSRLSSLSETSV
jgi:hypothetical protein